MSDLVMITGANGFVGRQVVRQLLNRKMDVLATYYNRRPENQGKEHWIHLDIRDESKVAGILGEYKPRYLVHCAWYVNPLDCLYSGNNLECMKNSIALYRSFYESGGEKAVYAGTCFEYDLQQIDPIKEDAPLSPATLYGVTKANLANSLLFYSQQNKIPFVWARLFYMYGPGEYPERVFPYVINSLLDRTGACVSPGWQVRDYSYVTDIANALVEILLGPFSGVVNIGSGTGVALRDVFQEIEELIGYRGVQFGAKEVSPNEPQSVIADTFLLNSLGIHMATSLHDGLRESIDYWKFQKVLKK